jgi:hypothetical protein
MIIITYYLSSSVDFDDQIWKFNDLPFLVFGNIDKLSDQVYNISNLNLNVN